MPKIPITVLQNSYEYAILIVYQNYYIVQVNNGLYTLNLKVDNTVNRTLKEFQKLTRNIDSAMFAHKIDRKAPIDDNSSYQERRK